MNADKGDFQHDEKSGPFLVGIGFVVGSVLAFIVLGFASVTEEFDYLWLLCLLGSVAGLVVGLVAARNRRRALVLGILLPLLTLLIASWFS